MPVDLSCRKNGKVLRHARKYCALAVSCLCLFTAQEAAWAGQPAKEHLPAKQAVSAAAPDRLLARITPEMAARRADWHAAARANGLELEREYRSLPRVKVFRLQEKASSARGLKSRLEALRATGLFDYVEPDWQVRALQLPTDASFVNGDLWGLENTGQNGGVAGIDINVLPVWPVTSGSPDVLVGVVDTGIRLSHQDLSGNLWTNPGEIPNNGLDDDGNGFIDDIHGINAMLGTGNPNDDHGHGSHVAGTISATAFDAGRHVGVAYNVRLMGLKFLDGTGNGTVSGAITCIDYAIANGVDILNNSWGGTGFSQALEDAVAAADAAGILFIAAAGNSGANNDVNPMYPASHDIPNVVSVAAIDRTGTRAYFSNYGQDSVDLAAPGVAILSSTAESDSSYDFYNGTSMATPHVSGVAALLASQYPGASIYELKSRLLQSTTPLPGLTGLVRTGGMVNAGAAMLLAEDGDLEWQVNSERGALLAGDFNTITVFLTDLVPVTGATVEGYLDGDSPVSFLDDGVAPDTVAGDAVYTASLAAPAGPASVNLNLSATAPGKNPSTETVNFTLLYPPDNDDFADRFLLSNATDNTTGSNDQATVEPGEPIHPENAGLHTAWWEWIPDVSGEVTVTTSGSDFDTTLAIYQGDSLGGLVLVGANDDKLGLQSAVQFTAVAGQSYKIQVNGYDNASGDVRLNYGPFTVGVPNDDFVNRIVLENGTTQTIGTNVGATLEEEEQLVYLTVGFETVWWEWIAPSSDPATIDTAGSDFDTILGIWEGDELGTLLPVAGNDDFNGVQSSVTFTPVAGQSYKVQVYGYLDATGTIVLNYPDPGEAGVANDYFHNRIVLEPGTTQAAGTNLGATVEVDEPLPPPSGDASVWWEWNAPTAGTAVINTIGSDFDTTLAVYTGEEVSGLIQVAFNDDSAGPQSSVSFLAEQGGSYKIQVNGSGAASGEVKLNYPQAGAPRPPNDDLAQRGVLEPGSTQAAGSNTGATLETDEPVQPAGSGSRSIWWEWNAPNGNEATIDTEGSDFDTTLAVYTGTRHENLVLVAENNDNGNQQSSVTFTPVTGTAYLIQVNGFGPASGTVQLNYPAAGYPRPVNDQFANRIVLSPGSIQTFGATDYATSEPGEPLNPLQAGGSTAWWEWIAPASGEVTIHTIDSTFDTTLAVYTGDDLASLNLVGANDNFVSAYSGVTFTAVAGESYKLQVDGYAGEQGLAALNYPMPYPLGITPGRLRLSGSPGGFTGRTLELTNADSVPVDFTISPEAAWMQAVPDSGFIAPGASALVNLTGGPLPPFADAIYTSVEIETDHPDLALVQIPIEVIRESLVVNVPDPNLRRALELHLGRLPGEPLADIELAILTQLDAPGRGIADLSGLEYAINLFYLFLPENEISDIAELASLQNLFLLDLRDNFLSDISPLLSLPILFNVDVRLNFLDINPGSDDRTVIDTLSQSATVDFDPQKTGMMDLAEWADSYNLHPQLDDPEDVNNSIGLSNELAFAMGLDPLTASGEQMPVAERDSDTNRYTFTYFRNLAALGITTSVLASHDLVDWQTVIPVEIRVIWSDGSGHQLVEAVFEDPSGVMFFSLETSPY